MSYGTSTHAQRLAWQWDETHAGLEDDLPLEEVFEVHDEAFRHWDTLTFAPAPIGVERDWRDGAAAAPPVTDRRGPALTQPELLAHPLASVPVGGEAGGKTAPSEPPGLANPSWQNWLWTA